MNDFEREAKEYVDVLLTNNPKDSEKLVFAKGMARDSLNKIGREAVEETITFAAWARHTFEEDIKEAVVLGALSMALSDADPVEIMMSSYIAGMLDLRDYLVEKGFKVEGIENESR